MQKCVVAVMCHTSSPVKFGVLVRSLVGLGTECVCNIHTALSPGGANVSDEDDTSVEYIVRSCRVKKSHITSSA